MMKTAVKIISLVTVIILLLNAPSVEIIKSVEWLSLSAVAEEASYSEFIYSIDDGKVTVEKYTGEDNSVIIPGTIDGYPVGVIGGDCFYGRKRLEDVTIPASVAMIKDRAFSGCLSLSDIYYTGTQEQWDEIIIGVENESIVEAELHFIKAPDETTTTESETTEITTEVTAEETTEDISSTAVQDETTSFAESTTSAEESTTQEPDTTEEETTVITEADFCGDKVRFTLAETGVLTISGSGEMWDYNSGDFNLSPFHNNAEIHTIVIGDGVTSVGRYAFYGCTSVSEVRLPDSVTHIGKGAFWSCDNIVKVHFSGSAEQWEEISVGEDNDCLAAKVHTTADENGDGECDICHPYQADTTAPTEITTSDDEGKTTDAASTTEAHSTAAAETTTVKAEASTTVPATHKEELSTKATSATKADTTNKPEPTTTAPVTTIPTIVKPATVTTTQKEKLVVKTTKPAKVKIKKPVSKKKKQIVVMWKAVKNVNGYQVAYSTSKKFAKKVTKTKIIKKSKTTKTTLKKLKSGKKYFIRLRAYKTVNGKKVYGAWSKTVNVKVK